MLTTFKKDRFKNTTQGMIRWASVLSLIYASLTTVSAQPEIDNSNRAQPEISQTQKYVYRDTRSFRMNIPAQWVSQDIDSFNSLASYSSNEGGYHQVFIGRYFSPTKTGLDITIEAWKQGLQEQEGQSNFVLEDGTLGSGDKFKLLKSNGLDQKEEDITLYKYTYFIKKGPNDYVVAFTTTNENMSATFAQMVNSIQVHRG